jgi:hypothetical protein
MAVHPPNQATLAKLSKRFQHFAEIECRGSSLLYEQLALGIAADEELLRLAARIPAGQPPPNLLFAAVHYLLLQDPLYPLANYYPSLTDDPQPPEGAFAHFQAFCRLHQTELIPLLQTRRVQTNEIRRCAYLLPAFELVSTLVRRRPLALIEIGTSAGLNLLWDRYRYEYGADRAIGDPASPITIRSAFRGDKQPTLPALMSVVRNRVGIDIHVVDVTRDDEARWLRALIWPEHRDRVTLLTGAIEVLYHHSPRLLEGDGTVLLPSLLDELPLETAVCLFHTHTFNQVSDQVQQQFAEFLRDYSRQRVIYRLACEGAAIGVPQLTLTTYQAGTQTEMLLAYCDPHGRWIEWLAEPPPE